MKRNKAARRGGLQWVLIFAAAMVVATLWAQTPDKPGPAALAKARAAMLKKDTSPIRPTIPHASRNTTSKVFLERADELRREKGADYQIVTGNVEFRRGGMFMYCDSAHFYDAPGAVEAFGNVRMRQGDTLHVYADYLIYTDTTQLAVLFADFGRKVRLINRDVTLSTDIFNYDLGIDLGFYEVGGVLTDPKNELTSVYGEYSPTTKDALFREDVKLTSRSDRDTMRIFSEQLLYNTGTHIALLDTTSTIISHDGTIHTTSGVYNTETEEADLYSRSLVVARNGNTLTGDTLYYDQRKGYGHAEGNVVMTDTTRKAILTGDRGVYFETADSARVWGRALAREYSQGDTLYLHGDTIRTWRVISLPPAPDTLGAAPKEIPLDSVEIPLDSVDAVDGSEGIIYEDVVSVVTDSLPAVSAPDSVEAAAPKPVAPALPDTVHYLAAYPNVRFFRSDMQGICDSMAFVSRDSLLHMHRHPVVWNGERQIFGNIITVHLNDSTVDWARLPDFGFMAEHIDEEFYNQLTGKEMFATFEKGHLRHLDVSGNVQAIMLPQENDSTYNKIANVESSYLAADFNGNNIEKMKLWSETSGTMTPLYLARRQLYYLPAFRWFAPLRPVSPEDVFIVPREMKELMAEPPFGSSRPR